MKKLLSIALALLMVLGLTAVAKPVRDKLLRGNVL